jgi:hypothetical protein
LHVQVLQFGRSHKGKDRLSLPRPDDRNVRLEVTVPDAAKRGDLTFARAKGNANGTASGCGHFGNLEGMAATGLGYFHGFPAVFWVG